jgi:hypothetical protein
VIESNEGDVLDLRDRTGYQPDVAALARSHVVNARRQLGLDRAEFASVLRPLLPNHKLTAGLIEAWESTAVPPGDVLVAVGLLTRSTPVSAEDDTSDELINKLLGRRLVDVAAVFPTRSEFCSRLPPHDLLDGAQTVDVAGLSLNLLCQQYPEDALRQQLEQGATYRCLFLEPGGGAIAAREREEGYPPGHLSALTEMNIRILAERVAGRLSDEARSRLHLATYDATLRFNLVFVDHRLAVVQPYLPFHRGVEAPTVLLRRQRTVPGLFATFAGLFDELWARSTSL